MNSPSSFGEAAVALAGIGIAVFPLQPREKKPYANTAGFKDARANPEFTAKRWRARPDSNIGIATGARSGFWVVDVDGPIAEASLEKLIAEYGPLPETVEQKTGRAGSGRHLCFLWPERCEPGEGVHNSAGQLGEKIDVRGCGGYIVAPPSIHPSGRVYAWVPGRSPFEREFAVAPAWLWDLAMPKMAEPRPISERAAFKPTAAGGDASRYGEVALTRACADIATAAPGTRNELLYRRSFAIGCLVAGGEIAPVYARKELIRAGEAAGDAGSEKKIISTVLRALSGAESFPRRAPEMRRESGSDVKAHTEARVQKHPESTDAESASVEPPADPSWPPVLDERDDLFNFIGGGATDRKHDLGIGRYGGTFVSSARARIRRRRRG